MTKELLAAIKADHDEQVAQEAEEAAQQAYELGYDAVTEYRNQRLAGRATAEYLGLGEDY